jgi:hypothetical protein
MRRIIIAALALPLAVMPALGAEQAIPDAELAQFRAAYTSGEGLAYTWSSRMKRASRSIATATHLV